MHYIYHKLPARVIVLSSSAHPTFIVGSRHGHGAALGCRCMDDPRQSGRHKRNSAEELEMHTTIKRIATPLLAATLVAGGVIADRTLSATSTTAAADTTSVGTTTAARSSTSTSSDAAIERAFAIASPSVVYVDNVGVGTGS